MNKKTSCHLVNFREQKITTLFLLLFVVFACHAQQIPSRPTPPRLVNDYTNTLSSSQEYYLEQKLRNYNDTTSTQIAVVFVNDLQGTTAADFAYQIGEQWGVGTKENNGIVILVKPKNETKGEVFISVGYGLEQYVPDAMAKRIIENQMIPSFKNNDYFTGVNKAVDSIIKLASGGFSSDSDDEDSAFAALIIIIGMIAMIIYISLIGKASTTISSKGDSSSFWKALFWLSILNNNSNRHRHHDHHDYWGGFSGGSGGFGGGSFGGFGGGSFGGGGAGGSW